MLLRFWPRSFPVTVRLQVATYKDQAAEGKYMGVENAVFELDD